MRCNCESVKCDHGEQSCSREATELKIMYVGNVCKKCWQNIPKQYRISPPDVEVQP